MSWISRRVAKLGVGDWMEENVKTTPKIVQRDASTLPQGAPGQTAYFTVSGRI